MGGPNRRDGMVRSLVLSARITRYLSSVETPAITAIGASNTVRRIFFALRLHGAVRPSWLADQFDVDRSVISRSLTRLQALGLVNRRVGATDRRHVTVALTARGRRVAQEYDDSILIAVDAAGTDIDELLGLSRHRPQPAIEDTAPASLDRLARAGSATVAEMLEAERTYSVRNWSQRFTLWAAADEPGKPPHDLAQALNLPVELVDNALTDLVEVGLLSLSVDPTDPELAGAAVLTPSGWSLIEKETEIFAAHDDEFVAALASLRSLAGAHEIPSETTSIAGN